MFLAHGSRPREGPWRGGGVMRGGGLGPMAGAPVLALIREPLAISKRSINQPFNYLLIDQIIAIKWSSICQKMQTHAQHNNYKNWRPDTVEGMWRLFFFDCDKCMMRTLYDHISEYTNASDYLQIHEECTTFIFRKLLENREFRTSFIRQFLFHLNTTFNPDTVIRMINQYQALYLPIAAEHIYRWQRPNEVIKWIHNVDVLRKFALQRPSQITLQLNKNFGNPCLRSSFE